MGFIAELRRRNVIRMAGLYLVGAWLIVQVAGTLLPMFDAPAWIARGVVVLLAIGFVPALVFSWAFELTPDGLRRDAEVSPAQSIAPQTARRMDRWIIAVLLLALVFLAFDRFVLLPRRQSGDAAVPDRNAANAGAPDRRSIAVLSFVDMSPAHDQEYFSDGMAEELLNRLAQVPELRVAARTSAFRFKGQDVDVAQIARQLQVAHVLEGSVRKDGARLRITAQLIDAGNGFHLWSQTFDRDAGDVFKVQDEIAGAITAALKTRLVNRTAGAGGDTAVEPAAYDDYLQGRAHFQRRGDALKDAVAAFDRAIARNPTYAAAHSARAFALAISLNWNPWLPLGETVAQAQASADKALELDPRNVEAHIVRGYLAMSQWHYDESNAEFARALALDPDNVDVLNFYGDFQLAAGNLREAERLKKRAMALDPLAFVHPMNLVQIHLDQARLVDAQAMAERSRDLGYADANFMLMLTQALLGHHADAERSLDALCRQWGEAHMKCIVARTRLLVAQGRIDEARAGVVLYAKQHPPANPEQYNRFATSQALVGDIKGATESMRRSIDGGVMFAFNPLRLTGRGELLPEELSTDPEWLALWTQPKVRDWYDAYRRNVVAFRNRR
ncbi:MAG: tetratricopeptide repeat protein [Arenimonas sp.]